MSQTIKVSKKPWTSLAEYDSSKLFNNYENINGNFPYEMLEARTRDNIINVMNNQPIMFYNGTIASGYTDDSEVQLPNLDPEQEDPITQFLNINGILSPNPNWCITDPQDPSMCVPQIDDGRYMNDFQQERLKLAQITFIEAQLAGWRPHFDIKQSIVVSNGGAISNSQSTYQYADEFDQLPFATRMHLRAMQLSLTLDDPDFQLKVDPDDYVKWENIKNLFTADNISLRNFSNFGVEDVQAGFDYLFEQFVNGDLDARFKTEVNGKKLQTSDGEIKFHSTSTPTSEYELVEQTKLDNFIKELPDGVEEEDLAKDTIYITSGTLEGSGLFDGAIPTFDYSINESLDDSHNIVLFSNLESENVIITDPLLEALNGVSLKQNLVNGQFKIKILENFDDIINLQSDVLENEIAIGTEELRNDGQDVELEEINSILFGEESVWGGTTPAGVQPEDTEFQLEFTETSAFDDPSKAEFNDNTPTDTYFKPLVAGFLNIEIVSSRIDSGAKGRNIAIRIDNGGTIKEFILPLSSNINITRDKFLGSVPVQANALYRIKAFNPAESSIIESLDDTVWKIWWSEKELSAGNGGVSKDYVDDKDALNLTTAQTYTDTQVSVKANKPDSGWEKKAFVSGTTEPNFAGGNVKIVYNGTAYITGGEWIEGVSSSFPLRYKNFYTSNGLIAELRYVQFSDTSKDIRDWNDNIITTGITKFFIETKENT